MTASSSTEAGDLNFLPLFRSPFLLSSVAFHSLLLMLALHAATLTVVKPPAETPISVQLLEPRDGASSNRSIGPGIGPGGPRTMPKLGTPTPPAERRGRLDAGSLETSVPAAKPLEAAPAVKSPPLSGPKILADARSESVNVKETSPDSLVRLPTKETPTQLPSSAAADHEANQRSLAALRNSAEAAGIRALREGAQIPGALKGTGTGAGPMGVPGGSPGGTGMTGGGTGTGTGGGSSTGLKGSSGSDFDRYLEQVRKRVESVWKHPEGVSGVQRVEVVFTLDRAGRLMQAEVVDSTDSRVNASAVEAMKRAAPFAPLPENLKDFANTPVRARFTVRIAVRS